MSVGSFGRTLTPGPDSRKAKLLLLVMGHVLPKEARPRRSPPGRARSASSGDQCQLLQAHRVPAARRVRFKPSPVGLLALSSAGGCGRCSLLAARCSLFAVRCSPFAEELYAVPLASVPAVPAVPTVPTVPTVPIVAVGVGALVVANVVALPAARHAARVPTALALRAE
jgi:hypothetical protein